MAEGMYDGGQMSGWRSVRMDVIKNHYGEDYFKGKTVLEVAAAWGHIGNIFQSEFGAKVTCTDHYDGWVDIIKERYPNIKAFVQNINDPWPKKPVYDVLIHMGVVYHQPAEIVEVRLREALKICKEIILETSADDNADEFKITPLPKPEDLWEPIGTEYCQPTTGFIERILREEGFTWTRVNYTPSRYLWLGKKGE